MIGFLRGKVIERKPPHLLLDVHGVGYELEAPMPTFYALQDVDEALLFTHFVVREDAQLLYAFSDQLQRDLFRLVIKINGVGPKVALAILSTFSVSEFVQIVRHDDIAALTQVPGVGKKTAEVILIGIRDRINKLGASDAGDESMLESYNASKDFSEDAIGALIALGYKANDASKAVNAVKDSCDNREDMIRGALQILARR